MTSPKSPITNLQSLITPFSSLSGHLRDDMVAFLTQHGCAATAGHSMRVAAEAVRLAHRYSLDAHAAEQAAWLHDISAVIPGAQRVAVADHLGVDVLPEERAFPMVIHQKLSAVIARDIFGVTTPAILSAIACHTTLKAGASALDMVVFVADKIKWDQAGDPPYLAAITAAADHSLDAAAWCYLEYLWQRRASLAVVHPWLAEAHRWLSARI